MLSIFFPLGINVGYEHRLYKLGETIDLSVELIPRRYVELREARVDLVRYTRHTEVTTVMVPPLPSRTPRLQAINRMGIAVSKHVSETYTDADIHGSVVFVEGGRLSAGSATIYKVRLEIGPEWPTHRSGSTRWRLVTTVDIGRRREITARRPVRVTR